MSNNSDGVLINADIATYVDDKGTASPGPFENFSNSGTVDANISIRLYHVDNLTEILGETVTVVSIDGTCPDGTLPTGL